MVAYQVKISSKYKKKNNELRWLTSDVNFKLLHIGCPIASLMDPPLISTQVNLRCNDD